MRPVQLITVKQAKIVVPFVFLKYNQRTMADGTDEESAYAARMDEWIAWESRGARDGIARRGRLNRSTILISFLFSLFLYGGTPAPETCAQRTVEGEGSLLL